MKSFGISKRDQDMPPVTAQEVHKHLKCYIRTQPDLGVFKGFQEIIFNQRNPFDDKARRTPKPGVVLFGLIAALVLVCFFYFNS